jgi:hypothetical protein
VSKAWKQRERDVAAIIGTKRTPLSGGNSGHSRSDTRSAWAFIENKHRKKHATGVLLRKTRELARKEKKIPIVTYTEHQMPGSIWCIHSSDLIEFATHILQERDTSADQIIEADDSPDPASALA